MTRVELSILKREFILADEIENYKTYKSIEIHSVYGAVAFITNHPTNADIIPIEAGKTYTLENVTMIVRKDGAKAFPTIVATLYK